MGQVHTNPGIGLAVPQACRYGDFEYHACFQHSMNQSGTARSAAGEILTMDDAQGNAKTTTAKRQKRTSTAPVESGA